MNLTAWKERKQALGYSYARIAKLSGVPLGTVQKIFSGETKQPRYETRRAIEWVLMTGEEPRRELSGEIPDYAGASMISEEAMPWQVKRQGEYTVADYYAMPDEPRVELIDGVIYDMGTPTTGHQLIAAEIYRQIANYILDRDGKCTPFISPIDVQIDRDERTMVQPDVIIVCDPDQITTPNIQGAPDFVLEVVSPESREKDYLTKLYKYQSAGVREYWLVDPYQGVVLVYFFERVGSPTIYPIDHDIPVNIYDGDLVLRFDRIAQWAGRLRDSAVAGKRTSNM